MPWPSPKLTAPTPMSLTARVCIFLALNIYHGLTLICPFFVACAEPTCNINQASIAATMAKCNWLCCIINAGRRRRAPALTAAMHCRFILDDSELIRFIEQSTAPNYNQVTDMGLRALSGHSRASHIWQEMLEVAFSCMYISIVFGPTENSAIRSADSENPTLERNNKRIGWFGSPFEI